MGLESDSFRRLIAEIFESIQLDISDKNLVARNDLLRHPETTNNNNDAIEK